jgi:hypothetical protein
MIDGSDASFPENGMPQKVLLPPGNPATAVALPSSHGDPSVRRWLYEEVRSMGVNFGMYNSGANVL